MPVKIALNLLYKVQLLDRVYGPEFTLRVCDRAAADGIGVYLYGSYPHVVKALREMLLERYPKLRVVGCEPSIFRPLTEAKDKDLANRVIELMLFSSVLGAHHPLRCHFLFSRKKVKSSAYTNLDSLDLALVFMRKSLLVTTARVLSQLELNNRKNLTHFECRTLRWNEMGKQENKNLLPRTRLRVVSRGRKASQSFDPIAIAKDYEKI